MTKNSKNEESKGKICRVKREITAAFGTNESDASDRKMLRQMVRCIRIPENNFVFLVDLYEVDDILYMKILFEDTILKVPLGDLNVADVLEAIPEHKHITNPIDLWVTKYLSAYSQAFQIVNHKGIRAFKEEPRLEWDKQLGPLYTHLARGKIITGLGLERLPGRRELRFNFTHEGKLYWTNLKSQKNKKHPPFNCFFRPLSAEKPKVVKSAPQVSPPLL